MEDLFALLRKKSSVPDGTMTLPSNVNLSGTELGDEELDRLETSASHIQSRLAADAEKWHELNNMKSSASSTNGSSASVATTPVSERRKGIGVSLKDVHFTYPGTTREVLRGVNILISPGESVAVVGPSGSGKSTLLSLLVRLFDVSSGVVSLDGLDIREISSTSLRSAVAVVPQETVLFNDTILHNVAYGLVDARPRDVVAAAKAAKLDEAVGRMSDGWATMVGERGLKLSGGEKQRVAIARAFLR